MARDRLPPIEFETVDDVPHSSESAPQPGGKHAKHRPQRPGRWVVAGAVVVLVLVAATTMSRLSDERDQAKADAARTQDALVEVRHALSVEEAQASNRAPGPAAQPPASLLADLGAMFTLPSSPSLVEGAIGILVTEAGEAPLVWVVVDGRGAVPGDDYFVEGGVCDNGTAMPFQANPGPLASGVSTVDGDLRLVGGPVGPGGLGMAGINDSLWARLRHNREDLGGVRGPLAYPIAVAPGANPCDLSLSAGSASDGPPNPMPAPSAVAPLSAGNSPSSVHSAAGAPASCPGKAYVVDNVDGLVSVIDTATGIVSAAIPVGSNPGGVAVTPDGAHAYVTDAGSSGFHGTVWVIDTATGVVSAVIDVGTGASEVAITPDGTHAYVTHWGGTVSVIDTATTVVSASIDVGRQAGGIAITPDGTHAYVTHWGGTVSVIDTATGKVSAPIIISRGDLSLRVAITPDGTHAYVTGWGQSVDKVWVIDTATGDVSAAITNRYEPESTTGVAITPDGTHAYVTDSGGGSVVVIETATGAVSPVIDVGGRPDGVAITPDGKYAYVASSDPSTGPSPPEPLDLHGRVSVINTATGKVSTVIDVGNQAGGVAICPS